MPIEITCSNCSKRYAAPDALAGKRVVCKNCATPINVPLQSVARPIVDENAETFGAEPALKDVSTDVRTSRSESSNDTSMSDDPLSSLEPTLSPAPGGETIRYARGFDYPHSREVDRFLPWVLTIGAALLLGSANISFTQTAETGRMWLDMLSLLMLAVIYVGVVWPLGLFALRLAARVIGFRFPSPQKWNTFSIYALPYALLYLIWTLSGASSGFVTGLLVAVGLTCGLVWVLVRPTREHTPGTVGIASGAMVGSALLMLIVLMLTNLLVFRILDELKTAHEVKRSPFGPTLAWDAVAPPVEAPKPTLTRTVLAEAPTTSPTTQDTHAVAPDSIFTQAPTEIVNPVTAPADADKVENSIAMAVEDRSEAPSIFTDPKPKLAPEPEPEDPDALAIVDATGEKVGSFLDVLYPTVPSEHMAVVRERSPLEDSVERWNATSMTKHGEVRFRHNAGERPNYILSPNGDFLVRVVDWPQKAAQVWSFEDRRVARSIQLNDQALGKPELVGFVDNERFLVMWRNAQTLGFQIINAKTPAAKVIGFGVNNFESSPGNPTISPDGRFVALAARAEGEVQLQIIDIATTKTVKRLKISSLDRRWQVKPSGIAFAPDMSQVGVLFEHEDNALVLTWKFPSGVSIAQHIYPAGVLPEQPARLPRGRVFDYLGGHDAFLLYGQTILNAAEGGNLGELPLSDGRVQRLLDKDTLHVVTSDETDARRLVVLKLKPDRLQATLKD